MVSRNAMRMLVRICLAGALGLSTVNAATIVDLDGSRFPADLMIVRRPYDEFHTVCPDRACMLVPDANGNTWFYANTSRVPLNIITYGAESNRYKYYLNTVPGAPYYLGRPAAQMPQDKALWFYCAQDGNRGTPNPQIRGAVGWSGNRIWVNNRPGEGSLGDEPYRVDCGPMDWWSVFIWHRRDFIGSLSETDYAGRVEFDAQSTISLVLPGANDQYFRTFAAPGWQDTWVRFVVRNGTQYYLSEAEFFDEYDAASLSNFNNSDAAGKRWIAWNPTSTAFNVPEVLPSAEAVMFDDVREVGFYFRVVKQECPHHDYTATNYSISSFRVTASAGGPVSARRPALGGESCLRACGSRDRLYSLQGRVTAGGAETARNSARGLVIAQQDAGRTVRMLIR